MSLETSLLCFSILSLVLISLVASYFKFELKFKLALILFTSILLLILFLFGIDFYKAKNYLKAFDSTSKNKQCGRFEQIQVDHSALPYLFDQPENFIYIFKTNAQQVIEFNGEQTTQQLYPLLFQLQKNDQICFEYATDVKDWNGRFYLTQLTKTTAPLD